MELINQLYIKYPFFTQYSEIKEEYLSCNEIWIC